MKTIQYRMLNFTSQLIWIIFHNKIKGNEETDKAAQKSLTHKNGTHLNFSYKDIINVI